MWPRPPRVSPFPVAPKLIISTICNVFFFLFSCLSNFLGTSVLHGLSTQQVPRQQGVDWGGATHDASLLGARGSPQSGVLLHAAPQQLSACLGSARSQAAATAAAATAAATAAVVVVPVGRVADRMGGPGSGPAHSGLIGAWSGLPAGGSAKQLALCKKAIDFLFTGELCQYGGVSQHAPGRA